MQLDEFENVDFNRGASASKEAIWLLVSSMLVSTWLPGSKWRVVLLRAFGAKIGANTVFKPRVRVKFPWRLNIGDNCWIGEDTWLDNLAQISIGNNVCVSQGCYLCTGSHDWTASSFDLIVETISIEDHAWVAAKAILSPGVSVGAGTVVTLGSIAVGNLQPWSIYSGTPAAQIKTRSIAPKDGSKSSAD